MATLFEICAGILIVAIAAAVIARIFWPRKLEPVEMDFVRIRTNIATHAHFKPAAPTLLKVATHSHFKVATLRWAAVCREPVIDNAWHSECRLSAIRPS